MTIIFHTNYTLYAPIQLRLCLECKAIRRSFALSVTMLHFLIVLLFASVRGVEIIVRLRLVCTYLPSTFMFLIHIHIILSSCNHASSYNDELNVAP